MKVICSVCRQEIKDDGEPDGLIVHGICEECNEKIEKELKEHEKKDNRHRRLCDLRLLETESELNQGAPGPWGDREMHPA